MAVDEHQPDGAVPGLTSGQTVELLQTRLVKLCFTLELHLGERSKARVFPFLVLRGGKAQLGEAGEGRLAERADPPVAAIVALSEEREARAQAASEVSHRAASPPARPGREGGGSSTSA